MCLLVFIEFDSFYGEFGPRSNLLSNQYTHGFMSIFIGISNLS